MSGNPQAIALVLVLRTDGTFHWVNAGLSNEQVILALDMMRAHFIKNAVDKRAAGAGVEQRLSGLNRGSPVRRVP